MSVRVRYAPSPTGHLHIGNARTALFNYLFARKKGGTFIVRIEDTDLARNVDTGIMNQLDNLKWLGIEWDESIDKESVYGPYRQMERIEIYQAYAQKLLDSKKAYKCYCTPEELATERAALKARGDDKLHYSRKCLHAPEKDAPYTIRFLVLDNTSYQFNDLVKGNVTFQSEDIGDWVILKQNGIPTYNFACAIDDELMKITHVLRGEDHLTNTPKQIMIQQALNFASPTYAHMTLIVNEQHKKLSKRDESIIQFIDQYRALGYLPEAMFNFISLLGFSPEGEEEILTKEAMIDMFNEQRLSTSPARFDKDKLTFINNRYLKKLSSEATHELCKPFLIKAKIGLDKDTAWFESLIDVFKDRLTHGAHIVDLYQAFFRAPEPWNEEVEQIMKASGVKEVMETLHALVDQYPLKHPDDYKVLIKEVGQKTGAKGKGLFMPIRIAVSGAIHGPDLPKMMHILGQKTLIKRLSDTLKTLT